LAHPNDPVPDRSHPAVTVLPTGETVTLDGSTVADPESGEPVPAAVLRLPVWRLHDLAAALSVWTRVQTLVLTDGVHLPTELPLADHLVEAAEVLSGRRMH
jgi:hypothetical protein